MRWAAHPPHGRNSYASTRRGWKNRVGTAGKGGEMEKGMFTTIRSVTFDGEKHGYFQGVRSVDECDGFKVGDVVTWEAFTDHRGVRHEAVPGLRVESIEIHASKYGGHTRIKASGAGYASVSGNAKFFTKAVTQ